MGRVVQMLPTTDKALNEEAKALIGHLEPVLDTMNEYERNIVGNIKEIVSSSTGVCNRTGLIFLRATVDYYLKEEREAD